MQTRSTSTNDSSNVPLSASTPPSVKEAMGEDAVRQAASAVINRSSDEGSKRVRRRSRKARNTPLLDGGGLKFHYVFGALIAVLIMLLPFRDKLGSSFWRLLHPPAPAGGGAPGPAGAAGAVAVPAGPPPWWFHPEVPALIIAFLIWLYLIPGVGDKIKTALGLKKDKTQRSRRRHS